MLDLRNRRSALVRASVLVVALVVLVAALTLDFGQRRGTPAPEAASEAPSLAGATTVKGEQAELELEPSTAKKQEKQRQQAITQLAQSAQKKAKVRQELLMQVGRRPLTSSQPTEFTIASFNLLGAGHTRPGGNRPGWAAGPTRMNWSLSLLQAHDIDLVGFQEYQPVQHDTFMALTGGGWGVYPGPQLGAASIANSIAYRLDTWELVSASSVDIPYFGGNPIKMPVILLKNKQTGRQIYIGNFHNPADAQGPAQQWRNQATAIQINLVNQLRAETGLPVFITGDMNEREEYFCPMTTQAPMKAAQGGSTGGTCQMPPKPWHVDWVFGSTEVEFSNFVADRSPLVARTTDHPIIKADVTIPPAVTDETCYPVRKDVGWVPCDEEPRQPRR